PVSVQQLPQIGEKLLDERAVEAGLLADGFDPRRIVGHVSRSAQEYELDRVAGAVKGQRIYAEQDQEDGRNPDHHAADYIDKHELGSRRREHGDSAPAPAASG